MTSGGNNVNYFPENQLNKVSAVMQFKHSEKKSCFVGLLCCIIEQYRLHIEGNLNGSRSAHEELSCHNQQCLSMIFSLSDCPPIRNF